MANPGEIEKLETRWLENMQGLSFAPLAEAYRKAGRFDEAFGVLETGLAHHPDYVPAHIVRGRCHADTGNDGEAALAFNAVLERDSENVIALMGLAEIREREGDLHAAVGFLERLLEVDRANEQAEANLGRLRESLGSASGAVGSTPPAPAPLESDSSAEPSDLSTEPEEEAPLPADPGVVPTSFEGGLTGDVSPIDGLVAPPGAFPTSDPVTIAPIELMGSGSSADDAQDELPQAESGTSDGPEGLSLERSNDDVGFDIPDVEPLDEPGDQEPISSASSDDSSAGWMSYSVGGGDGDEIPDPVTAAEPELIDLEAPGESNETVTWDDEPSPRSAEELPPWPVYTAPVDEGGAVNEGTIDESTDLPVVVEDAGEDLPFMELGEPGEGSHSDGPPAPTAEALEDEALDSPSEGDLPRIDSLLAGSEESIEPDWQGEPTVPVGDAPPSYVTFEEDALEPPETTEPVVEDDSEPELVVTESMAEVFLRQGHNELALAVYTQLLQGDPTNARLQEAIDRLTPTATPEVADDPTEPRTTEGPGNAGRFAADDTGGESVGVFLSRVLSARDRVPPVAVTPPAVERPPEPTRPSDRHFSLESVFGDDPGSGMDQDDGEGMEDAGIDADDSAAEGSPSFDEFFGSQKPTVAPASDAQAGFGSDKDDLRQFNAWLKGLKR